ncbi:MAG: DNA-directed RNA polymerase subunit L [Candidatus Methanofastidiosum methylothiophilum]|jgi:DNA-directed RNA polymerase subunit L|uniref:DNA-directed RNA polymerase subunit Rpo11 n=1 Tax=Candidatus Methanofastidiosum methylothiophilum TaxID=1705564 RepID=A0A150JB88_9EURY|nr:MAG: DNA-directed RNA polymerase subunit L [Candidatus Methanofastidiosum methylthiophilus]MBP6932667.1 DNA-directed RNA polymerase subunit L [Methanofastidiosum sp.]OQC50292.1 MAG: DNA-directed RNA polymerase subunit L [Euryarchaeota archaeon ADurb.Bin023]KYC56339.1 MAG: DNA-directed RNA polymerase subunit L [Candidatus Methanofastidiosum methylthiophilus]KYC57255.1 MAG: DNA-directed RNA polymerase subunit L [Candidatus Methanofastidiosum methylthiophilus]
MDIEVLKNEGNLMEFRIIGEDHTLCNVLRDALLENQKVKVAAYKIDHPLLDKKRPKFIINTDGTISPKDALLEAIKSIEKDVKYLKQNLL